MWNAAVTNAGAAILAQWIAGGTLTIDGAAAGTGRVDVSALAASTAMAGTRHTLAIASYAVSAASRTTTFRVAISAEASAYTLTQIGIWGHVDEGSSTLLAIYQTDEGIAVPASSAMPEYSYIFGATVAVNGSGELSVTVDTSIAVTHAELDADMAKKLNAFAELIALETPILNDDEIAVGRDGTGYKIDYDALASAILGRIGADSLSASPSLLVNLGSASAADVMQASPRPGVTGTLGADNGGTGQTTLANSANALINALSTGSDTPNDADYFVSQYVNGGASNTKFYRRPFSALWNWIKAHILPVSAGGTGLSSSPSMLTNLGSTTAANVLQASPRPGVTGTLGAGNGGTGCTSLQATRNAMGLGNTTGALPVANGGTGQTTLAAARNAMGLGNTTGALPAANGGTGQTSLQATRNAMGLGNTTGALPIANGGTGATTAAGIRNAIGLGNTTGAVPIAAGGTGATTVAAARNALGLGNTSGAVPVANGGTGSGTKGISNALANLGLHHATINLSFNNGLAEYNFTSNVQLISVTAVATDVQLYFYRSSGYTQYRIRNVTTKTFTGTLSVDLIYVDR